MDDDEIEAWWKSREREGTHPLPHERVDDELVEYECWRCHTVYEASATAGSVKCPECGQCIGCG